jgi:hypothetical protein
MERRAANGVILPPKGKEKGSAEIESFAGFREYLKKVKVAGSIGTALIFNVYNRLHSLKTSQLIRIGLMKSFHKNWCVYQNNVSPFLDLLKKHKNTFQFRKL